MIEHQSYAIHIQDAAAERGHPSGVRLAADFLHPFVTQNKQQAPFFGFQ